MWGYVVIILLIFITVWMSLTFTNQFCATGPVAFGLCYKSASDPACPTCPVCPPAPAPSPSSTTSHYMPEPVEPYSAK